MSTDTRTPPPTSFAEEALRLGGKGAEEVRRMGAVDTADDQVEALFAARYQTTASPIHRAVWDAEVPGALWAGTPAPLPPEAEAAMQKSLAIVRRHRAAGTLLDENRKIPERVLSELGEAGYWGLLVDRAHGGSGVSFTQFAKFLTQMATLDPTVAGLASVHGCIGAVDPVLLPGR